MPQAKILAISLDMDGCIFNKKYEQALALSQEEGSYNKLNRLNAAVNSNQALIEDIKKRGKEEYSKINDYKLTIKKCHSTVGVAILNTSITIVFGFSILVLSNFIPTIYFGIFTGVAMLLAMISVLTLLPALLLVFQPFEKNKFS